MCEQVAMTLVTSGDLVTETRLGAAGQHSEGAAPVSRARCLAAAAAAACPIAHLLKEVLVLCAYACVYGR
jgi:hypothetical protein